MTDLKLIAFDEEDLKVLSAHLQDAVVKVSDLAWLPRERRFVAMLNRFDWQGAGDPRAARRSFIRKRTALRFERVEAARLQAIELSAGAQVLSLLAISFEPGAAPAGSVTLLFAGGAAIRLQVECIEAEMMDLGAAWHTRRKPDHPGEGSSNG